MLFSKKREKKNFFISEITVLELFYGAENSEMPEKSLKAVDLFIKGIVVIPVSTCVKHYAKEKVRLRRLVKPVNDEFDLIIGVTAIANGLILVTDNVKDFSLIDGIKIENWFR